VAAKKQILLLEDDPNLGFVLQEHLEAHGFGVQLRTNGEEGLTALKQARFALMLVDIMMPRKDGFTFAREVRKSDTKTPIIFLTAKSLKEDRIEGFRIGADDYVTKPFSSEELLLRVNAVLKRTEREPENIPRSSRSLGSFTFDSPRQLLVRGKKQVKLTSRESELLLLLSSRPNATVDRSEILQTVWSEDTYFNSRSLDVFISKLRKLLAADKSVEIKNVHGKGYKLICR
jgi:DNA-binding response OmpR family regulator